MLLEYLQDYTDRVKPLLDQNDLYGKVLSEFEKKWENGTFPGWPVSPSAGTSERWWLGLGNFWLLCLFVERDEQRFDTCRCSSGPLCFLLLGGKIDPRWHVTEIKVFYINNVSIFVLFPRCCRSWPLWVWTGWSQHSWLWDWNVEGKLLETWQEQLTDVLSFYSIRGSLFSYSKQNITGKPALWGQGTIWTTDNLTPCVLSIVRAVFETTKSVKWNMQIDVVTSVDEAADDRELLTPPVGQSDVLPAVQLTKTVFSVCQVCLFRHV